MRSAFHLSAIPATLAASLSLGLWAGPAQAWDQFGHMLVAAIAYEQLADAPATRARVDALIKLNPAYASWVKDVPAAQRGETAFVLASHWPDAIKSDPRYVDDGRFMGSVPVEPVASQNKGYGDKARHKYWHYKDVGFSTDGTAVLPPKQPDVQGRIELFRSTLASAKASQPLKSYDLTWLIHLVGDIHQPLHATARFTADLPHGDVGGNKVAIHCPFSCPLELHAFWDDALGRSDSPAAAISRIHKIAPAPADAAALTDVSAWLAESVAAARADVYTGPIGAAGQGPYVLDQAYRERAVAVSEQRVALAGARLARLIRDALK